jgi:hypothetical protein
VGKLSIGDDERIHAWERKTAAFDGTLEVAAVAFHRKSPISPTWSSILDVVRDVEE